MRCKNSRTYIFFPLAVLLLGVAAGARATAGPAPFGPDSFGGFEPTKPLAGDGWQLLSANGRPRTAGTQVVSAQSVSAPVMATAPVAPAAQAAPAPADLAPTVLPSAAVASLGPVVGTPSPTADIQDWAISPSDGNYRRLIEIWAARAGWQASAWELEKDVPVEAVDTAHGDFKAAVRYALSATELTDYVLKPCFYSNRVVRVVKVTTKCDISQ
ncbi:MULTISPECIES: TcpQ domain-containing protein [unclassified Cupriavidus]|uniref:TcpQ domain-containing protein n=1 Tax=unclassified Cupriavidus TaxID=2640874 RepID=UPI0009F52351|nr:MULTISPECIES: TcpQ domain-containing protein [unclassified Cupriavidus]